MDIRLEGLPQYKRVDIRSMLDAYLQYLQSCPHTTSPSFIYNYLHYPDHRAYTHRSRARSPIFGATTIRGPYPVRLQTIPVCAILPIELPKAMQGRKLLVLLYSLDSQYTVLHAFRLLHALTVYRHKRERGRRQDRNFVKKKERKREKGKPQDHTEYGYCPYPPHYPKRSIGWFSLDNTEEAVKIGIRSY